MLGDTKYRLIAFIYTDKEDKSSRHNNPIDFILFTQLYSNSTPKYQWINDIKIWDSPPPK